MKRGFLLAEAPSKTDVKPRPRATNAKCSTVKRNAPSALVERNPLVEGKAACVRQPPQDNPISVWNDTTATVQISPLILLSDTLPQSTYFGYFPPGSSKPEMVLIHNDLEKVKAAANWPVWKRKGSITVSAQDTKIKIVPIEGKGLGMVATRAIRAGELIYQERPVYAVSERMQDHLSYWSGSLHRNALSRLGKLQQEALMSLSNAFSDSMDTVSGIIFTNNLRGDEGPTMFPDEPGLCVCCTTLSRANHSCVPCANYTFDFDSFYGRFYAVRNIQAGEEITIMYKELDDTKENRQKALFKDYRFHCQCEACIPSAGSAATRLSDKRRLHIKDVLKRLDLMNPQPLNFDDVDLAIKFADAESLAYYKARLLFLGSQHILTAGFTSSDPLTAYKKGRKMLEEAADLTAMFEGDDTWSTRSLRMGLQMITAPGC